MGAEQLDWAAFWTYIGIGQIAITTVMALLLRFGFGREGGVGLVVKSAFLSLLIIVITFVLSPLLRFGLGASVVGFGLWAGATAWLVNLFFPELTSIQSRAVAILYVVCIFGLLIVSAFALDFSEGTKVAEKRSFASGYLAESTIPAAEFSTRMRASLIKECEGIYNVGFYHDEFDSAETSFKVTSLSGANVFRGTVEDWRGRAAEIGMTPEELAPKIKESVAVMEASDGEQAIISGLARNVKTSRDKRILKSIADSEALYVREIPPGVDDLTAQCKRELVPPLEQLRPIGAAIDQLRQKEANLPVTAVSSEELILTAEDLKSYQPKAEGTTENFVDMAHPDDHDQRIDPRVSTKSWRTIQSAYGEINIELEIHHSPGTALEDVQRNKLAHPIPTDFYGHRGMEVLLWPLMERHADYYYGIIKADPPDTSPRHVVEEACCSNVWFRITAPVQGQIGFMPDVYRLLILQKEKIAAKLAGESGAAT